MADVYQSKINEIDQSSIRLARGAVIAVVGPASKGPLRTSTLINSEPELERLYGREIAGSYAIAIARQILRAGGKVRFSRCVHQTTAATFSTRNSAAATITLEDRAGTPLDTIKITAKEEGTWADGVAVTIANATSGSSTKFKLTIAAPGLPGIAAAVFDEVAMADVAGLVSDHWLIENLASATASPNNLPALGTFALASGANGTTNITDLEQLGNSDTNLGIYALSSQSDFIDVFAPDVDASASHVAFKTWAETNFKVAHLTTPSTVTAANIQAFREKTGTFAGGTVIDSTYVCLHFGRLQFKDSGDPLGALAYYPNAGGFGGVLANNDTKRYDQTKAEPGPWKVASGTKRGVTQAFGVEEDISTNQTLKNTLDLIGVNWFEVANGVVIARGNNTLSYSQKLTKSLHVRRMLIRMRQEFLPILDSAFDEPSDPFLWRDIERQLNTVLDRYVTNRAISEYIIQCDQDAKTVDEAMLNTAEVRDAGQLKIIVRIKPLGAVKFIDMDLVVDSSGVNYAEAA